MKKTNMWQSWWTAILLFIDQSDKTIRCSIVSSRSGYKVKDRSAVCFSINLSRLNTQLQASMGLKAPFKSRTYWHCHFSNPLTIQNTFYYLRQARDQAHILPSLFWSYTCLKLWFIRTIFRSTEKPSISQQSYNDMHTRNVFGRLLIRAGQWI